MSAQLFSLLPSFSLSLFPLPPLALLATSAANQDSFKTYVCNSPSSHPSPPLLEPERPPTRAPRSERPIPQPCRPGQIQGQSMSRWLVCWTRKKKRGWGEGWRARRDRLENASLGKGKWLRGGREVFSLTPFWSRAGLACNNFFRPKTKIQTTGYCKPSLRRLFLSSTNSASVSFLVRSADSRILEASVRRVS